MTPDPQEHNQPITLLVVDDQASVRDALAVMLDLAADICVVATAGNGAQAAESVRTHHPDVVLMDLNMPVMNGVEATAVICTEVPDTAVLVLTTFDDDASILGALQAGASGYLMKDANRSTILRAVRTAAGGETVLSSAVQRRLLALASSPGTAPTPDTATVKLHDDLPTLTARESEILDLIGEGLRNTEIAAELVISEATVKTHINNLFAKAGFRSRSDAVRHVLTRRTTPGWKSPPR